MPEPLRRLRSTPSLGERAEADLRFIRGAMERSGSFTALPGRGGMVMGCVALAASIGARLLTGADAWLALWTTTALVGATIGVVAMRRKAAREGLALLAGPGRRFLLCLCPALVVGAFLTAALARAGQTELLPGMWLSCYGAGVVAAGAFSPAVVPITGAAFLVLGGVALVAPPAWGDTLMGAGFGVGHIVSGSFVARHHGG
jgi:hypothetical protein